MNLVHYWEDAKNIDEPGLALLWATAALARAAFCHDKGRKEEAPDCLILTKMYLDRFREMPRAYIEPGAPEDALNTIAAHIDGAIVCYRRNDFAQARRAVALATDELTRFFWLISWNTSRQPAM